MSSLLRSLRVAGQAPARAFSTSARRELARITIVGNLAGTPEVQETSSGRSVVRYNVASHSGPRDNRLTSWFRVTSSAPEGRLRDYMLTTPKGSTVFVEGNAQIEQWQGQDGQQKSALKIWQTGFEVLRRSPTAETSGHEAGETGEAENNEGYGHN